MSPQDHPKNDRFDVDRGEGPHPAEPTVTQEAETPEEIAKAQKLSAVEKTYPAWSSIFAIALLLIVGVVALNVYLL